MEEIEILGTNLLIHSLIRVFELLVACPIKFLRYHLPLAQVYRVSRFDIEKLFVDFNVESYCDVEKEV